LFDCVNESRPGVTSGVLTPLEALKYLEKVMDKRGDIKVVGIAGPGDPFANAENTIKTLELVRNRYSEMLLCVSSNGLNVEPYAGILSELKVSHVTITINAIDPEIGSRIYSWVRYGKKIYRGIEGAKLLHEKQMESIALLKKKGTIVKINAIIIPGINDKHMIDVARAVKTAGADILNCIPIYPNKDTVFEEIPEPDKKMVADIRINAGKIIDQMNHCARCRADAVGLLEEGTGSEYMDLIREIKGDIYLPSFEKPYIAVTSREGYFVNQHLGEANIVWIYKNVNNEPVLVETRKTPDPGEGDKRWEKFCEIIGDCNTLITGGAGDNPSKIVSSMDINMIIAEGFVDEMLKGYFSGKKIAVKKNAGCGKGVSCSGTGAGC
jgi:nitrogen fixation protein NifB